MHHVRGIGMGPSSFRSPGVGFLAPCCKSPSQRPILRETVLHEDWPARVSIHFHDRLAQDAMAASPLRRLALLKASIREVSASMEVRGRAGETLSTESLDDKVGCTMRFIRAAEAGRVEARRRRIAAYPHLAILVADPFVQRSSRGCWASPVSTACFRVGLGTSFGWSAGRAVSPTRSHRG